MLIRLCVSVLVATASVIGAVVGGGSALAAGPVRSGSPLPSSASRQLSDDLRSAWEISRGQGVTVAVLSTGVDPSIPGLAGKVTTGPSYAPSGHAARRTGSIVAGMIAGSGDLLNMGGLSRASGVAPMARVLSIRIDMDDNDPGASTFYQNESYETDGLLAEGIRYAADHGAQVIFAGLSEEDDDTSAATEAAASYALSRGDVIVANDWSFGSDRTEYHFPAAYPGSIGVTGVNVPGEVPPNKNLQSLLNASMLVAAPDNSFPEPGPTGEIWAEDGPEAAAAWVAGTAALIKSAFPHLSPVLVGRAMALSARYHPAGGYNTAVGFGLVNPAGALQEAAQLSRAHTQAAVGQTATTRFRSGPPLPVIDAVHHSRGKLTAYAAVIVFGVLCLIGALVLLVGRLRSLKPDSTPPSLSKVDPGSL